MPLTRRRERTLAQPATVRGIGFLTGADVQVTFLPAGPGQGVRFVRTDLPGHPSVPARLEHVIPRQRRTTLQQGNAIVEMVEHVMAALAGLRIDNCTVAIDAPEAPGLDGSSLAYVQALDASGVVEQSRDRDVLVIDRPIAIQAGKATVSAYPGEPDRLVMAYSLDYGPNASIVPQSRFLEITPEIFRDELAPCRTFLLEAEAHALRAQGIGARTTEQDLLIFGPNGPIGGNTLRFPDECARHKLLDMVGDLALIGKDLNGHVVAHRSGHVHNADLGRALCPPEMADEPDEPSVPFPKTPTSRGMDLTAILGRLPHRYPFLLVDRVLELEPGRWIVAVKNVTYNEPYFQGHWPGRPIMPGVLIVEALAQAAGLMATGGGAGKLGLIAAIDRVKLRRPVAPGDQLRLEANVLRARNRTAEVQAVARVDGRIVAEAKLRFVLVEAERAA